MMKVVSFAHVLQSPISQLQNKCRVQTCQMNIENVPDNLCLTDNHWQELFVPDNSLISTKSNHYNG